MTRWAPILLASLTNLTKGGHTMKLLFAILVALAFGGPAVAQQGCGTYAGMIAQLDMKYGEVRLGSGRSPSKIFELWVSEETGTWTILEVFRGGMACMRAAGENWTVDPPVPPGAPV